MLAERELWLHDWTQWTDELENCTCREWYTGTVRVYMGESAGSVTFSGKLKKRRLYQNIITKVKM
jgi:hypothetical protein